MGFGQIKSAKLFLGVAVVASVLFVAFSPVRVDSASSIAQGFETESADIVAGALVSMREAPANLVELAAADGADRLLGVVGEDSLIELSSGDNKVDVVTTGSTVAFASDINGDIKTGDRITASPIAGIGMKATGSGIIIGLARQDLSSVELSERTVTDRGGADKKVKVGAILVQVDKSLYTVESSGIRAPEGLQEIADQIAGHAVSPMRVIIAGFVVFVVLLAVIMMIYSSVRSSIISIGRNPLSEDTVRKSMINVGMMAFGVMIFSIVIAYLILTV